MERSGSNLSKKIADAVRAIIEPAVTELGYDLVDVEYRREAMGYVLTVYIDKRGGVTLDDCERVSVALDPLLDAHDPVPGSYYLSVSSPGLDRPLKNDADLQRHLGKMVDVRLYKPVERCKIFVGTLLAFDEGTLTLTAGGRARTLNRRDVACIKPYIEI